MNFNFLSHLSNQKTSLKKLIIIRKIIMFWWYHCRCCRSYVRTLYIVSLCGRSVSRYVRNGLILPDHYVGRHILANSVYARLDGVFRLIPTTNPSRRVNALHTVQRLGYWLHWGRNGLHSHLGMDSVVFGGSCFYLQEIHLKYSYI